METSSTKRIDTLNILRVLALFLTFVSHSYLFDSQVFAAGIITFPFAAPAWACMWVLFTLSGYLAGRGFALERYSLTWDGVKKYYLGRLFKIWMPTVLFIFLTALFVYPDFLFGDSTLIFRCVPLSFTPIGGPDGIGATWFVFTIMWLYLLTPLFCWASKRLSQKGRFIGIVIVVFGGLGYRLLMSHFVQNYWQDYLNYIYLPPVGNLDFYVAGILAAHREKREKRRIRWMPLCICCLMAYYAVYRSVAYGDEFLYRTVYSYFGPTLFLIATLIYVCTADPLDNRAPAPVSLSELAKNPLRGIINRFSNIGFEFYLFHSLILNRISPYIYDIYPVQKHLKLMLAVFVISIILAFGFHMFSSEFQKRITIFLRWLKEPSNAAATGKVVAILGGATFIITVLIIKLPV